MMCRWAGIGRRGGRDTSGWQGLWQGVWEEWSAQPVEDIDCRRRAKRQWESMEKAVLSEMREEG